MIEEDIYQPTLKLQLHKNKVYLITNIQVCGSSSITASKSYSDAYNAHTNSNKEVIAQGELLLKQELKCSWH